MKITDVDHAGHAAVELVDGRTRMRIVHDVGPRIAFFGRRDNLLYWDDEGAHRRGEWRLYGGHRFWIARPGADESEETYAPDNEPCRVRKLADGVAITAPVDAMKIEKTLVVRAREGVWTVEHRLRNASDMLWAGGAWGLTATKPRRSTRYRIPLDGGEPGWDVVTVVIPRSWGGGHTSRIADPQFTFTDDALEFRSRGVEGKRMVYAPRGTLEMSDERGTFTKSARAQPGGTYPYGANLAAYLAPRSFMVELETMSTALTLLPGRTVAHAETWTFR
ncbi:MAG TPA: hypothetical protein VK427_25540 [Kofleriaceae bacterium]|nr:hypothetical protein [Kofleriaceae bacterium]